MKTFKVIIGNPPFIRSLHLQCLQKSLIYSNQHVLFVHPASWLCKKENDEVAIEIKRSIVGFEKTFKIFNGNPVFKIGLFRPCSISKIDKLKEDKKVTVINDIDKRVDVYDDIYSINKFGDIPEHHSLLQKLSKFAKKDNFDRHLIKKVPNTQYSYYINIAIIRGHITDPNTTGVIYDVDFYTIVTRDSKVETKLFKNMGIGLNDKEQAENCLEFMKTKFCRFCLSLRKVNQHLRSREMSFIPWLDFSEKWDEDKIEQKFNITEEEWEFINNSIPDYY